MESAFSSFRDSAVAKRALLKYGDTPFDYVIENARAGEKDALYYLVLQSLKPIASAFYIFYKKNWQTMDRDEASHEFFNEFLIKMYEYTAKGEGPIFSFNRNKFSQKEDEFILNKFRYYMYSYAMALAKKMEQDVAEQDIDSEAMDDVPDTKKANTPFEGREDFIEYLRRVKPQYYDVMAMLADRVPTQDIYNGLGITKSRFYQITGEIKKMYSAFAKRKIKNESVVMAVKALCQA